MWFADIYCDPMWVSQRKGILGPRRFALRGAKSLSLGIAIEFHFFGDGEQVRHLRVLMHTEDRRTAETCLDLNIQTWIAALEVSIMMETNLPFRIALLPGSQTFAVVLGQGSDDAPAALVNSFAATTAINYERIARGMGAWSSEVRHHLFYFRRFVDSSLPLDVRWLNGYRLLEWIFVGDKAHLGKSSQWRAFVAKFDDALKPLVRLHQSPVGLLEEARALAAHAGLDDRSESERANDPRNAMEKTFPVLEGMVIAALNEHPAIAAGSIRFEAKNR